MEYECMICGAVGGFYTFRGTSSDSSCLKCFRCGSTDIKKKEELGSDYLENFRNLEM